MLMILFEYKAKETSHLSIDKTKQGVQRLLRFDISVLLDYESLIQTRT